uniref:Smoothelin domain-containing protein n=1 Tax=Lygus hesperus TaxID=30085 RepID=A0A0A9W117_LYGHE
MAAEVHSDLNLIQDEDVLRRMWADTPDFGRKKEIRARMYKLREQRLKDFYTAGDVSQITRKHQTTRHTESIGDQGFLSMKTKEIRDSESPTRDFSRAVISTTNDNTGYWNSRQENSSATQDLEGGGLLRETIESTDGRGIIRGEDCETELALGSENRHTRVSKKDENSSYEGEALNQSSKMASVTKSDTGTVSTAKSEQVQVSKSHAESTSADQQSTTKSWSSSSRSVNSSSKKIVSSSTYRVSSDGETLQAITLDTIESPEMLQSQPGDLIKGFDNDTVHRNERSESRFQSSVNRSDESRTSMTQRKDENISETNVVQRSDKNEVNNKYFDQKDDGVEQISLVETIATENQKQRLEDNHINSRHLKGDKYSKSREVDTTETANTNDSRIINNQFSKTESVKSETESVTNQKIMSEIQKLDSYLSTHTPAPSTPMSPRSTTDVANWTIVSKDNRDNEFTYEPRSANQVPEKAPASPRGPSERVDKNLSNIDLPKDATDGQYVTTYQSHYTKPGRISVDNSPSHDYFASTLRSSPDRQTPSPNKKTASRGSLDRTSPERKWRQSPRTTKSPSVERATPESRPESRTLDRKSPERKQRTSPTKSLDRDTTRRSPVKSPERERKPSTSSYTVERPRSETRKKSEVFPDNKPKRKFSSTQQKQATKARASTPGSSPTRKDNPKDFSDSDSDNSQATFNKSKSDIRTTTTTTTENRETTTIQKENSLPKEESSEYFSEGSVTNELKRQESPERRAFTPIKNFRTNPESGTFIVGERRQVILESEITSDERDDKGTVVDDSAENVESRKYSTNRRPNSPSQSPSLDKSTHWSPGKQSDKRSGTRSSPVDDTTATPLSTKADMEDVITKQINETKVTEVTGNKRTKESRKKIDTDSDRSASVSPERKIPLTEKRASPERRVPDAKRKQSRDSPDRRVTSIRDSQEPERKASRDSPDRKEPSMRDSQEPKRKASRDSPDRKFPSARSSPEKSPSSSPERKIKSPRKDGIGGLSPDRFSKSPSASPERTTPKKSSPDRNPSSPVRKVKEVSSNKVESSPTQLTRRRSSIPTPDNKTIPNNVRAKPQGSNLAKSIPAKPVSTAQRPSNIASPKQTVRSPPKQSPQMQPSQTPQKQIQRSIQKPSTVRTQKLPESNARTTPKTTATSAVSTQKQVTKVTSTRVTNVNVVKSQEKPRQTSTIPKPHTITVVPKKSPNVTPQRQPVPKGSTSLNNRTPPTKSVPSRVQPVKKEPETRFSKGQVSNQKPKTATVRQTNTRTKTVNQVRTQQFIENECECLDESTDLEDVAPPDHFEVEIDEDEPKEQFEEIDVRALISRKVHRKTSKDSIKQDRKLKKRGISKEEDSSSSEDETDHVPVNGVTKGLLTAEANQDYLNVIVQHPKSSRESSPGYPSERIPVSTTSDDGESNPRYADFISEPEDVEIFDTLRGTRGPIPIKEGNVQTTDLDEDDDGPRPSVADKVNLFLEAAKNSLEPQESHQQPVEIDGSHSVRSAKSLFENISKTQATTVQTSKTIDIYEKNNDIAVEPIEAKPSTVKRLDEPRHVSPSSTEPLATKPSEKPGKPTTGTEVIDESPVTKTQAYEDRAVAHEPEFIRKKAYETHEREVIKETAEFKKREVEETKKPERKVTPLPEPLDKTINKPTKKPFTRNISASADVNSKRSFFERKAQEESKPRKQSKEEVKPVNKKTVRKSSTGTSDFMKSTVASAVRAQSPEKVQKPERKKTSENLLENKQTSVSDAESRPEQVRETTPVRKTLWRQDEVERKASTDMATHEKDTIEITSIRTARKQSPPKEVTSKNTPKDTSKSFDQDEDLRSPLKVRDSNTIVNKIEKEEIKKSTGTFGVTLRKTPSNAKILPAAAPPQPKKTIVAGESIVIEDIFDLEVLEKMLIKAVGYEERRSIRAQIKLVKKNLEEEHNRSGTGPTSSKSPKPKTWTSKEKSPERISSSTTSRKIDETTKFKGEEKWGPSARRSPERKPSNEYKQTSTTTTTTTTTTTQTRESPERRLTTQRSRESPERRLTKQRSRDSPEKTVVRQPSRSSPERRLSSQTTNVKSDSKEVNQVTTYHATVKTQSTRNVTTEVKEASATDSITSSYGVGPTDDDGKPLFGLRALRRTNTNKALEGETGEVEEVVVEKEQTRKDSTTEDILDSSGRPLFGGLKALQPEAMPAPTSQLKGLVERNQFLVQGGSTMESTKTVVTSHSSFSSDGKVSHRREIVRGELSAKNGEQPVGQITKSSYSYQKGNEKGATPQVSSKTVTSLIGGRRNSGPKIEEITDGSQNATSSRRYSKEYTVEEDCTTSNERRRSSTGLNEDNVRAFTSILRNKDESVRNSPIETDEMKSRTSKSQEDAAKRTLTRGDSIKALQHKYQQATVSSSNKQVSTTQSTRTTDLDGAVVTSSQTRTSEDTRTVRTGTPTTTQVTSTSSTRTEVKSSGATSFLDNSSKVTGVQDILQRMRNADLVAESGDTTEDAEARALLNKFLGASVILQGMEQGMKAAATHSSTTLVNQADKQWVKATSQRTQDDLNDIYDEKQLQILLDACSDYDERRKIRARLREVMAEKKGGSSEVAGSGSGLAVEGECLSIQRVMSGGGFDDSGTESGEDLRHLNPEVVEEVKSALSRLEGVIPGLVPVKRDAVSQLVTSLQSCLQLAPPPPPPVPPPRRFGSRKALRNRHTVSVTADELVQARKWVDHDNLQRNSAASSESILSKVFRPVHFSPPATLPEVSYTQMTLTRKMFHKPTLHRAACFMEQGPQQGVLSYAEPEFEAPPVERSISDSSSVYDYDPSVHLFTPEQSVQIAVHKAAINKQINREDVKRRGSSEDGDVSSADEEETQEVSSAQRLLQLASDGEKKPRFSARNSKKMKMKRANTIDIPKPNKFYDYSSDDYGASADETRDDMGRRAMNNKDILPPSFEPKTENDHKFLAFLQQVNDKNPPKVMSYNPSARGGKHWQNRFSTIKTTFEGGEQKPPQCYSPSPAKLFWQNTQKEETKKVVDQKTTKLPWTVKSTTENGVVVGSLTVSKPGQMNRFNHATKSAFKPVEKKPFSPLISPASGSVKLLVNQKFSQSQESPAAAPKPTVAKIEIKTTPAIQNQKRDTDKLASFNQNAVTTQKYYNIPSNVVNQDQPERRTPSAFAPYKQKPEVMESKKLDEAKSSYSQPKYSTTNSGSKSEQGEQSFTNRNGKSFQPQYVSGYKQPTPFYNSERQSCPQPQTSAKAQVRLVSANNNLYDHQIPSGNQVRANQFVPMNQEHNGNKFPTRENQFQFESNNHQFYEPQENKPIYKPVKNQNQTTQFRTHNDQFYYPSRDRHQQEPKPQINHVSANVIPSIQNQSNHSSTFNGANARGLNHSINSKFIPVAKPIAKVYPEQQPIIPLQKSYYSATINGANNGENNHESYDQSEHQNVNDPFPTSSSDVLHRNNVSPIESHDTSFSRKTPDQCRIEYVTEDGYYGKEEVPMPVDFRIDNSPGNLPFNQVTPMIGTVIDCSTLNQEIQNLTDITDTRILECQDTLLANEAAGGPFICNLRDASTINTDGEFVSNIMATSPGLRDSHFISPRPRSKSPKMDTPSSLPPGSLSANMFEMNNTVPDNVYYNNTTSSKPPTSLSFYSPNAESSRVKERPKTSSPYQDWEDSVSTKSISCAFDANPIQSGWQRRTRVQSYKQSHGPSSMSDSCNHQQQDKKKV